VPEREEEGQPGHQGFCFGGSGCEEFGEMNESEFKAGMEAAALWKVYKSRFSRLNLLNSIKYRGHSFRDGVKFYCDINDIEFPTTLHDDEQVSLFVNV
jgi:hypothetical protein